MASRRYFYCIVLVSIGLLAYLFGFSTSNDDDTSPGWLPKPAPLFHDSLERSIVKGPQRGLQNRHPPAEASTTSKPSKSIFDSASETMDRVLSKMRMPKDLNSAELTEINSVLGLTEVKKNSEGRKRILALHRPGPGGFGKVIHKSPFSFLDLKKPGADNPLIFATNVIRARLAHELGHPSVDASKFRPVMSKRLPQTAGVSKYSEANAPVNALVKGSHAHIKVGAPIPKENARQILIATTWRSGSSFFGDLLTHYPGTFYSFEPLHYTFQANHGTEAKMAEKSNELLKSLFKCQYDVNNLGYLQHASRSANQFLFDDNFRVWNVCKNLLPGRAACFMPKLYQEVCPLFPIRLIKTVRLRVSDTETHLNDPEMPNFKVIALFRDPRGTMNSRSSMDWCKESKCANLTAVCNHLDRDVNGAFELQKRYPGRVHLVRYEDLSSFPYETVDKILEFLDLPPSPVVEDYIRIHTSTERKVKRFNPKAKKVTKTVNPYGTFRVSKTTAFAWREKVDINYIHRIQTECEVPMRTLGYNNVHNTTERDNFEFPVVVKTDEEVWPFFDQTQGEEYDENNVVSHD